MPFGIRVFHTFGSLVSLHEMRVTNSKERGRPLPWMQARQVLDRPGTCPAHASSRVGAFSTGSCVRSRVRASRRPASSACARPSGWRRGTRACRAAWASTRWALPPEARPSRRWRRAARCREGSPPRCASSWMATSGNLPSHRRPWGVCSGSSTCKRTKSKVSVNICHVRVYRCRCIIPPSTCASTICSLSVIYFRSRCLQSCVCEARQTRGNIRLSHTLFWRKVNQTSPTYQITVLCNKFLRQKLLVCWMWEFQARVEQCSGGRPPTCLCSLCHTHFGLILSNYMR